MIGAVKVKRVFVTSDHIQEVKGEMCDGKNIGTLRMTRSSRESLATKASLRNAFSYVPNTRVPG